MRTYEALYIIQPELGEDDIQTIATGVEKLITDDGGAIVRSEIWGKRRLAYEVKGFAEGVYVLVRFDSKPTLIDQMKGSFRLNESVIRFLIVSLDPKTLRLEAEQQKRTEAQAQARALSVRGREDDGDDNDRGSGSAKPAALRPSEVPKEDSAPVSKANDGASEEKDAESTKPVEA